MKKLIAGLLFVPVLAFSFLTPKQQGNVVPNSDSFAPEGMVAYAASYASDVTNEPKYSTQNSTTFQYLNLGSTLESYRGDSVKVGIIDSGINYDHEDFMVSGSTKVEGSSKYYKYQSSSWVYYGASSHGYSYIDDTLGHGTNVAATVAAAVNSVGGLGLAPNVELYVYKVTNASNGYEFGAIQNALMDAVTLDLDVINMSFQSYEHAVSYNGSSMAASSGCSSILTYYLNQAYNAGITLVGAAGNYNTAEPSYPGSNNHVINVGSLNSTGTGKAGFSNYGSTIDLVAPGYVYVADEASNTAYTNTQGTSFSAPLVTAAIALYKQKYPTATPSQIESALYASCDSIDSGSTYSNWAGNGSLNVAKFLQTDASTPTISSINISPSTLNLDLNGSTTGNLTATVIGTNNPPQGVTWSSSNPSVATVSSTGEVTALKTGTSTITARSTYDSTKTGQATVKVVDSSFSKYLIGWGTASGSTPYSNFSDITGQVNGILSFSCAKNNASNNPVYNSSSNEIRLYYNSAGNGCSITLTPASGIVFKKAVITSNTSPTVKYSVDGGNKVSVTASSSTYTIDNISAKSSLMIQNANTSNVQLRITKIEVTYMMVTLSSISINTSPTKTVYDAGETFSPAGLKINRTFSDSTTDSYSYLGNESEFEFSPSLSTLLTTSHTSVTISYGGKSCSQAITVNAVPVLTSITISGYKTSFVEGDTFSFGGTVTANFEDSSPQNVTSSALFTGYDITTPGEQTVTVSYSFGGITQTAFYGITVEVGTLSSLSLSGQTTIYNKGDAFSFDGTCTAIFENGYQKVVTPTSVSSPNMNTGGQKEITVSYTYNNKTVSTSYNITVNSKRVVMDDVDIKIGTVNYSSGSEVISVNTISTSDKSTASIENNAMKLGSGSYAGSFHVNSTTANIRKVIVSAKSYGSDTGVTLSIGGISRTLTSSYQEYAYELNSAVNSITIATAVKGKRAYVQLITIYNIVSQDIGETEDCVGLETFINNNMHMDYTENKGWCADSEHHYYSTARDAFNVLNDHQRLLFTTNTAYSNEWNRLRTWAEINHESLNSQNKLGALEKIKEVTVSSNPSIALVVVVSVISLSIIGGYFYFKNKRKVIN